jgi:MYXO-CTERM domain-containing protein
MGDRAGSDRGLSWALVGALGLAAFGRRRRTI